MGSNIRKFVSMFDEQIDYIACGRDIDFLPPTRDKPPTQLQEGKCGLQTCFRTLHIQICLCRHFGGPPQLMHGPGMVFLSTHRMGEDKKPFPTLG